MKLKTHQYEAYKRDNPLLSIDHMHGRCSINSSAAAMMGITDEHRILFHHDEDSPADWYISVSKKGGVKLKKGLHGNFLFSWVTIARKMAATMNWEGRSACCPIGKHPIEEGELLLWTIITKRAKQSHGRNV